MIDDLQARLAELTDAESDRVYASLEHARERGPLRRSVRAELTEIRTMGRGRRTAIAEED